MKNRPSRGKIGRKVRRARAATKKPKVVSAKKKRPAVTLRKTRNKLSSRRRGARSSIAPSSPVDLSRSTLQEEKQAVETAKFTATQEVPSRQGVPGEQRYSLPVRYGDNRIVILPRDPWWIYGYWDISEDRVDQVVSAIPVYERQGLRWALRVYDVTGIGDFRGDNANSCYDIDINGEATSWYINVNLPGREWCVVIGFKNPAGKFFVIARSNIVRTPYFGISSVIDEEWALADEDYYKILGFYDLSGRSSLSRRQIVEEVLQRQVSSSVASWGGSGLAGGKKNQEDFFLEVWTEVIVHGRTRSDAEVTIAGEKVALRRDGTFSSRYVLPVGDFEFEVIASSKDKRHRRREVPAVKRYHKK